MRTGAGRQACKRMKKFGVLIFFLAFILGFSWRTASNKTQGTNAAALLKVAQERCAGESNRTKGILCYKQIVEEEIRKQGIRPFMEALEGIYLASDDAESGGITRCHDLAHAIGQVGAIAAEDPNQAVLSCTSLCTSGCYHGVVEGYLAKGENLEVKLPSLCGSAKENLSDGELGACYHGLGHGTATISGYDLYEALSLCDKVSEEGRRDCGQGVIMELYEPSSFDHALLEFPPDIPAFCNTLWGVYAEVCHATAGLHEYARSRDREKAVATCAAVPKELQDGCMSGLGQNIYFYEQGEATRIIDFCRKAGERWTGPCISGAVEAGVMSDPLARHSFALCQKLEGSIKKLCYRTLREQIGFRQGEDKYLALCKNLTGEERELCLTSSP